MSRTEISHPTSPLALKGLKRIIIACSVFILNIFIRKGFTEDKQRATISSPFLFMIGKSELSSSSQRYEYHDTNTRNDIRFRENDDEEIDVEASTGSKQDKEQVSPLWALPRDCCHSNNINKNKDLKRKYPRERTIFTIRQLNFLEELFSAKKYLTPDISS